MEQNILPAGEFLKLVFAGKIPENVLLPHEKDAVQAAYQQQVDEYKKIVDAKVSVSGGDDWHDGAFRATDNEAKIVSARTAAIAPFLGAVVVSYPEDSESRITLGSRVIIKQNNYSFPVDLVGFRKAYPSGVFVEGLEDEVTGVSPESPLGGALLGKEIGQEITYKNGDRNLNARVESIDQHAVKEYFSSLGKVSLNIEGL